MIPEWERKLEYADILNWISNKGLCTGGVVDSTWGTSIYNCWCFQQLFLWSPPHVSLLGKTFFLQLWGLPPPSWIKNIKAMGRTIRNTLTPWGYFEEWFYISSPSSYFSYVYLSHSLFHPKPMLIMTIGHQKKPLTEEQFTFQEQRLVFSLFQDLSCFIQIAAAWISCH